jgi:alkylation response protein AidB-like acyl-CoA dehydrogenase
VTTLGEFSVSEMAQEAAGAIRAILSHQIGSQPVTAYVTQDPVAWDVIRDGGWDLLAVPESRGGAGLALRELLEVARVWGEYLVALPLIPTLMARRWCAESEQATGPLTVASSRITAAGVRGLAPFGSSDGVAVLLDPSPPYIVQLAGAAEDDPYCPSLRLAEISDVTRSSGSQAAEMAVMWAAEATGAASRALHDAIAYAKEREQFGQPIGRFQAIKHHLANAHILSEQAETAVIWASLEEAQARTAALFALNACLRVVEIAVQVHGGMGFTWEMGLHFYLRHIMALRELTAGLRP